MKYIVIYGYEYTREIPNPPMKHWITPPTQKQYHSGFGVREFEDYEEAYRFSVKNKGYVLKPVEPIISAVED